MRDPRPGPSALSVLSVASPPPIPASAVVPGTALFAVLARTRRPGELGTAPGATCSSSYPHSLPDPLLVLDRFYLQVPEVDCVSLGIPGEEGPPCITPASERSSPKHEALLWTDRAIRLPNKAVSYLPRKTGLSSRDCVAGKWARPAECCCNKRSHARRRVWAACLITWCFHG